MSLPVIQLTERREEMRAVQWTGSWDDAVAFARMWDCPRAFSVGGDQSIAVVTDEGTTVIQRGDYVEVKPYPNSMIARVVRVLSGADVHEKWQPKDG